MNQFLSNQEKKQISAIKVSMPPFYFCAKLFYTSNPNPRQSLKAAQPGLTLLESGSVRYFEVLETFGTRIQKIENRLKEKMLSQLILLGNKLATLDYNHLNIDRSYTITGLVLQEASLKVQFGSQQLNRFGFRQSKAL